MAWVRSFTHLKDRPQADKALETLERIASLVKPIMRAKGWVLPVLSEFFPDNPQLLGLNVNHGEKILIRLRPPYSPNTFYDDEQLVLVMLHELTHNVHGPHDDKFYKYLADLETEWYALKQRGYTGEGFHSAGKRLTYDTHNVPMSQARSKAAIAADRRKAMTGVTADGGGRRLGGAVRKVGISQRELAADAAARRARDEKTCGSISEETIRIETQKAEDESMVDTVGEASSSSKTPAQVEENTQKERLQVKPSNGTIPRTPPRRNGIHSFGESSRKEWSCPNCTLINSAQTLQCELCETIKPIDPSVGWSCLECETQNMVEWWTCKRCGRMRSESAGG